MAASPAYISSYIVWSTPYTSEHVSRRDPPILSILILHSIMDLIAAAQLIFPVVYTDASLLSNYFAHVTEMVLCCSAFASLDQKSPARPPTSTVPFPQFVQQKIRIDFICFYYWKQYFRTLAWGSNISNPYGFEFLVLGWNRTGNMWINILLLSASL